MSEPTVEAIRACCRASDQGTLLSVRLVPRASRNEVAGVQDGALRVRVNAPPVEGRANAALLNFLAVRLGVRSRDLSIGVGERSRLKTVHVGTLKPTAVAARLAARPS